MPEKAALIQDMRALQAWLDSNQRLLGGAIHLLNLVVNREPVQAATLADVYHSSRPLKALVARPAR